MIDLKPLATVPEDEVEALLDAAFGHGRRARTAYRLREGASVIAQLSFAAFDTRATLVGTLQSWPVALVEQSGRATPLVMVGPVAVRPEVQRAGIGKALMEATLRIADEGVADALMMIGDPEYYGRFFGFTAEATAGWSIEGPVERHRLLARTRRKMPKKGELRPAASPLPDFREGLGVGRA